MILPITCGKKAFTHDFIPRVIYRSSKLEFGEYTNEWLDYIAKNRQALSIDSYDLVIGGIANDDVFNTLTLYFKNFIDKTEAIKRLSKHWQRPKTLRSGRLWICFTNQKSTQKCVKVYPTCTAAATYTLHRKS